MSTRWVNVICYTTCVLCILSAVVLAVWLIWGNLSTDTAWRGFATIGVLFFASLLTFGVNAFFAAAGERAAR